MFVSQRLADRTPTFGPEEAPWRSTIQPYVYYLALSPSTVKIGTTTDLGPRVRTLYSELQYVIALEHGGYDVEKQRHTQFAAERVHRRREIFVVSDRLQQHISQLHPYRDEMVKRATTYPLPTVDETSKSA